MSSWMFAFRQRCRSKDVRTSIKQLVLDLRKKHPDYGVEYETYVSVPGAEISKDHPLVKTIERATSAFSALRRNTRPSCGIPMLPS